MKLTITIGALCHGKTHPATPDQDDQTRSLTDFGIEQSRTAGKAFKPYFPHGLDYAFTSPTNRAIETLGHVCEELGEPPAGNRQTLKSLYFDKNFEVMFRGTGDMPGVGYAPLRDYMVRHVGQRYAAFEEWGRFAHHDISSYIKEWLEANPAATDLAVLVVGHPVCIPLIVHLILKFWNSLGWTEALALSGAAMLVNAIEGDGFVLQATLELGQRKQTRRVEDVQFKYIKNPLTD
jgi:broad specificity phosphatase PhoE